MPGLLKTITANKGEKLPHKIFEVADICLIDDDTDVGARNERHACILYSNQSKSGFEVVHGILDLIMKKFGVSKGDYTIEESENPTFFELRQVQINMNGKKVGVMGTLHPEVLSAYKI